MNLKYNSASDRQMFTLLLKMLNPLWSDLVKVLSSCRTHTMMVSIYINTGRLSESLLHTFRLIQWKGHTQLMSTNATHRLVVWQIGQSLYAIQSLFSITPINPLTPIVTLCTVCLSDVIPNHCYSKSVALLPVSTRHITVILWNLVFIYHTHVESNKILA
jgi:hypothetical protein